jgi:hypothetical protein
MIYLNEKNINLYNSITHNIIITYAYMGIRISLALIPSATFSENCNKPKYIILQYLPVLHIYIYIYYTIL